MILSQTQVVQSEYPLAYALVAAMILLGIVAVCVPRHRIKHFVEPQVESTTSQNAKSKRPAAAVARPSPPTAKSTKPPGQK